MSSVDIGTHINSTPQWRHWQHNCLKRTLNAFSWMHLQSSCDLEHTLTKSPIKGDLLCLAENSYKALCRSSHSEGSEYLEHWHGTNRCAQ